MKLLIHDREDISFLVLEGRLDADGVAELEQPFAEAVLGRGLSTVVDMSGVSFMSSLGIGMLFDNTKKLKKAGGKLVLLSPRGMVETVLKTSKMDKLMPLVYDLQEAVRMVGGDPTIGAAPATRTDTAAGGSNATTSGTPDNILKLRIKNDMAELTSLYAKANELLVRHLVPYRSGYATNLAIEELVVNIIRYAFMDDEEHDIDIGLGVFGEQILLEIRDDGRPFDPRESPPHNVDAEDLEPGGLGLTLVLDLVDLLTYRRAHDRNHVQVGIHIRQEEGGELWNPQPKETAASG
ncbi:MAG: anti-sigma factor antagonist [Pirellulaceae bacterium]